MKAAQFTIPGPPKGKGRPRVTVRGNYAHAYTPSETVEYENYVKLMWRQQCRDAFLDGAIKAEIIAYFSVPASASRRRAVMMLEGKIRYTKKIDCDNLAKAILDSLNGIAYKDDSQVCELSVRKLYGEVPKVIVLLTELDNMGS